MRAKRRSMWSRAMKLSGRITRSTDECEMSRSCQSAMFSSAACALPLSSRASPVICSEPIGLRLCGIADEPFWPLPNGSCTSPISVFCKPANFEREFLQRRARNRDRRQQLGMTIALNHLRGDRRRLQPELAADRRLRSTDRDGQTSRPRPRSSPPRRPRARASAAPGRAAAPRTTAPASARTSWARHARHGCGRSSACADAPRPARGRRRAAPRRS